MIAPCKDGHCLRRDGKQCPEDECHRVTGDYVEGWIVLLKRDPGGENGYELAIELGPIQCDQLRKDLIFGSRKSGWFEYKTPFGEVRLVNLARFDTIDFKPSGRNIVGT